MSIMGSSVSKAQNWGWVQSFFFLKNAVLGLELRLELGLTLTLTVT